MSKFLANREHARYLKDLNGNYYFWKGYDATHDQIAQMLDSNLSSRLGDFSRGGVTKEGGQLVTTLGDWGSTLEPRDLME